MKHSKIIGMIVIAVILSLLGVLIPATPALAQPTVILSPTSGSIGTKVTITATNFESFKNTDVNIYFNSVEIDNSPLTVPDTGRFTTNFYIPQDALPGAALVTIRTILGGEVAASLTILAAEIELYPDDGPVDTMVTIKGNGFYAGNKVTFYYYDSTSIELGTEAANNSG